MLKFVLVILFFSFSIENFAQTKNLYVSDSNGNDNNTGLSISSPFKTIEKAKAKAKEDGFKNLNVDVQILGGTYYLSQTLKFDNTDSRNNGTKIRFVAYKNQNVVISGGVKVPYNWTKDPKNNNIWMISLKDINKNSVIFRQLWVDDIKATRSQLLLNENSENNKSDNRNYYMYDKKKYNTLLSKIPKKQIPNVEVWSYLKWQCALLKVSDILADKIYFNTETPNLENKTNISRIENAYELIDSPGEWFYNIYENVLFYYPKNGNPNQSNIIFPQHEKLISALNCSNIEFNGVTFSHATWSSWPTHHGYIPYQGSVYIDINNNQKDPQANIEFTTCSNITIKNSVFCHLGGEGLSFQSGSLSNNIINNKFYDISGTGIRIGNSASYGYNDINLSTQSNTIDNNSITNVANEFWGHTGIWIGYSNKNTVINNTISDLPYSGISTGNPYAHDKNNPTYPMPPKTLGENTIENNTISNVLNKLRDGGAIYNHAPNYSTSYIRNNKICNVNSFPSSDNNREGIYLDQGSSNFVVTGNYGDISPGKGIFLNLTDGNEYNNLIIDNNFNDCSNHDFWIYSPNYLLPYHTFAEHEGNFNLKLIDVNHDGLEDIAYYRWIAADNIQKGVYINECGKGWVLNHTYDLPYHFYIDGIGDMGLQLVDFDNDGFKDIVYCRDGFPDQCKAYRNTGNGWIEVPNYFPPIPLFNDHVGDLGVRFLDVNNDKYPDLVYSRWLNSSLQHRRVYLNTKLSQDVNSLSYNQKNIGWIQTTDQKYFIPNNVIFAADGIGDLGVKIIDINNDGQEDLLFNRWNYEKGAYLKKNDKWVLSNTYTPNYPLFEDHIKSLGVKFIDVDHDNDLDMVVNRYINDITKDKKVWLNDIKNEKWIESSNLDYCPIIPTCIDKNNGDQGVLVVDINGDGYKDILQSKWRNDPNENIVTNNSSQNCFSTSNLNRQTFINNSKIFKCPKSKSLRKNEEKIETQTKINNLNCKIYPNPFSRNLNIEIESFTKIRIINSLGLIISEKTNNDIIKNTNKITFDFDGLDEGFYFIYIENGDNSFLEKAVLIK